MATLTLYCRETPGLKLGPGSMADGNVIVFVDGYATIDTADERFAAKMEWATSPLPKFALGRPPIEVLDAEEAPATAPGVVTCPECEDKGIVKAFATKQALNGHLIQHRRKG